jgi:hypothetical protein
LLKLLGYFITPFFSIKNMPRQAKSKEDIQRRKQEREREYRLNSEVKAKKKEQDRLYQQRKRDQQRLRQHEDPLAQLADITTQRRYLERENDGPMMIAPIIEMEEPIDIGGMVEDDGEILENFDDDNDGDGFNDDYDEWEGGLSDNGKQSTVIINNRIQYKRGGTAKS